MGSFDSDIFVDLSISMENFINDYFFKDVGCLIYHYASFKNTLSITGNFSLTVGGSTLYHTKFNSLSDEYEGKDVDECYHTALNKYFEKHSIDKKLYDLLNELKPDNTYYYYLTEKPGVDRAYKSKGIAYICCFSLNPDSELMWKNYLKGENIGFAIGYNTANLKSNSNDYFGRGYRHIIQKVLYYREEKIIFIYKFLEELLSKTTKESELRFYIVNFLNANKYVFKREKFAYEEEVRSVIFYPEDENCSLTTINNGNVIPFKFDFGTSIDDLVYYHNGPDNQERILISQTHIENWLKESKFSKD